MPDGTPATEPAFSPRETPRFRALNAARMAAKFGRKDSWWYKHRAAIRALPGFPPPLPLPGQEIYDERAVDAWLAGLIPPHLRADAGTTHTVDPGDPLAGARAELARRTAAPADDSPRDPETEPEETPP